VLPAACAGVLPAPSGLTSLASDVAPCHRVGHGHLWCCHQRVREVPAAPADLTFLTSDTAPCHRACSERENAARVRGGRIAAWSETSRSCAEGLLAAEIEAEMRRHQAELQACFDKWFRRRQSHLPGPQVGHGGEVDVVLQLVPGAKPSDFLPGTGPSASSSVTPTPAPDDVKEENNAADCKASGLQGKRKKEQRGAADQRTTSLLMRARRRGYVEHHCSGAPPVADTSR